MIAVRFNLKDFVSDKAIVLSACEPGDIMGVEAKNSNGNPLIASDFYLITKSLHPLPNAVTWENEDVNTQRKHQEMALLLDPEVKQTVVKRSQANRFIRHFFDSRGFVEVETPYLVPEPAIAPVKSFVVSNSKHVQPMDLRIANTEYIRRLLVGGFERVYQLGKCFRNEPASWKHDVEFTQLTFGIAYAGYTALMELIETLAPALANEIVGTTQVRFGKYDINLTPPWRKITIKDAIFEQTRIDIDECPDSESLSQKMKELGFGRPETFEYGGFLIRAKLLDYLVDEYVCPDLIQPTFLCEYPYELGGPAKEIEDKPNYKKRCEIFIAGMEIANISTPQNDPLKMRKWYNETLALKVESGWQNQHLDEPYLQAIDLGIPISTTGGLGLDRLLMLILNKEDIRDVNLFPWKEYREPDSI
jgi:lysyl-tRNA synthetase class 2